MAVDQALESVRNHKIGAVPNHLRDAHYKGAAKLGHGIGYKYAHDYPDHYVKQQYLPDELLGTTFMNQRKMDMRKISKNIWKKSESKIKMSTENKTSVLVLIFTPFIQK